MNSPIHLVRIPIDAQRLFVFARRSRALRGELDDGYAVHALMAALFDHGVPPDERIAPKPFSIGDSQRRTLEVLGYCRLSAEQLRERAERFSDPSAFGVCELSELASRPMPLEFANGTRLGFRVRVTPVRRGVRGGERPESDQVTGELDEFLARARKAGVDAGLDREAVYRDWLSEQLQRESAAQLETPLTKMAQFQLVRFLRQTQGEDRRAHMSQRPDVVFEGVLKVDSPEAFAKLLRRGVGRHRAFGFGMLLLRPGPPTLTADG